MALISGSGHSDVPKTNQFHGNTNSNVVRKSQANFPPSIWGDQFITSSPDDLKSDAQIQQRAKKLKEEVKKMLSNVNNSLQEMNLIDAIQRLGVAYHFEKEIGDSLLRIYNSNDDEKDDSNNLHAVALRFRLLRQEGYNVSPNVFTKFKDEGNFKKSLASDIQGLLSLYEAAYLGVDGEDILDEAIAFTREHLKSELPHLNSPLSTLVQMALDLPLRKHIERLQTRYYISIYQEEKERIDTLLEFAKLDFNLLQSMHQRELREISIWWKDLDVASKLPFVRDRVVECYFWIVGVYFEAQYSRARMITTKIIALTSVMDDIYDAYATLEELEPYTDAIQRWDRSTAAQLPEYMKLHFLALLDTVDKMEEELARDGKSYRINYLKEVFKELSKVFLVEAQWLNSGYVPTLEEHISVALISCGYHMLIVVSFVGMGDVATKEAFEWAKSKPKIIMASSVVNRLTDDIQSNKFEQERAHVLSGIQIYMKENGSTYEEACEKFREMVLDAWKDMNKECMKPTPVPMPLLMRAVNFARVMEVLYQHRDGYTNPTLETKEHILAVLVNRIAI